MTDRAFHAIRAAKNLRNWGFYTTTGYYMKRGVSLRLFLIALGCEHDHQIESVWP